VAAKGADRSRIRRPTLARHLYEPSLLHVVALIAFGVGLFAGCGLLASLVATMDLPLVVRVPGVAALVLAASHGGHLLGFVGHEGIHLSLHRNKYVSVVLGTFVSAMTTFSAVGYGIAHWNHHRFTNQASDPDAHIYTRFRTFWSRLLLARLAGNRTHQKNLVRMALGRPLQFGYKLPFSPRAQRALAWMNLGMLAFWVSVYAATAMVAPGAVLVGVVLPILALTLISGLRGYVEHGGTGVGSFRDTRSYASPLYTVLFFGNNFHLEHHLYPGVPCYRLPAVHRFLESHGYFEPSPSVIDATVLGPLAHTTSRSQYPEPSASDSVEDPFVPAVARHASAAA
jgi:fatty acid desaturase